MKTQKLLKNWNVSAYGKSETVTIPHDFMIGAERRAEAPGGGDTGFFVPGRAVYENRFSTDEKAAHHFLRFDGVMGLTEVFVNGNLAKFHPYGYTSFLVDADDYLKDGENTVRVTADTTAQTASRWYTGGGLIREAELLTGPADYIVPDSLYVRTEALTDNGAVLTAEVSVFSSKRQIGTLTLTAAGASRNRQVWLSAGKNRFSFRMTAESVSLWTPDTPVLYECEAVVVTDSSEDRDRTTFGCRTVVIDPQKGVLLNGEPVTLYGTCDHHDNGIVGSASFRSAEERRVRILKENGFNAIRTSHNPPSAMLLDVCDRMGMFVIDEAFDCWRVGKKEYDYHLWFEKYFEEDVAAMICRDRNHPSVILWSTGNEIPERGGSSEAYRTESRIAELMRALDPGRPLTQAFCNLWGEETAMPKSSKLPDDPTGKMDNFAARIAPNAGILDAMGYNYLLDRLDDDQKRFPDQLFLMTESFPMDALRVKRYMDKNPRLAGEFVWTGWDYFGETGLGHVNYQSGDAGTWGLTAFPNHISGCGDFSICGFRKPQSYYREIAWNPGAVRILTADPAKYGCRYSISSWGFWDEERTWTYENSGKTTVALYTAAEECELWQDGVSLGRKTPDGKGRAVYEVEYRPGKLEAAAYIGGKETGRDSLASCGQPEGIRITLDLTGKSGKSDLIYAEIELIDGSGILSDFAENEIAVTVSGGKLLGLGSGRVDDDHIYTNPTCRAYRGRLLAAILPDDGGEAVVIAAKAGNLETEIRL